MTKAEVYAEADVGKKFGRLTVVKVLPRAMWITIQVRGKPHPTSTVEAVCDCGNVWTGRLYSLRSGHTTSCGCASVEASKKAKYTTHGMYESPEYNAYRSMIKRCYNKSHKSFRYYGGRGIKVCDRWLESFENFYADMGPRPSSEHSLDRVLNDEGYSKENCRWATGVEQANNRSNVTHIEVNGRTLSVSQAAREIGMNRKTLSDRLLSGMSVEEATRKPVASKRRVV